MHLHWVFIAYIGHFAAEVLCLEPNTCFPFWNVLPVSVPVNIGMQRGVAVRSVFYKARSMAGQTTVLRSAKRAPANVRQLNNRK